MKFVRNAASTWLVLGLTVLTSQAEQTSEFLRLCHASKANAEALFAACKQKARPFSRQWLPSGRGPGVPEEHSAWFYTATAGSHFGFGCVLGPKDQVRFFGLYFFLKQSNFHSANAASFNFIDFQGNAGLRSADGTPFTLLAVHKLTPPGHASNFRERNCDIGRFDPDANLTVYKIGDWLTFYKVDSDIPTTITQCTDREVRYEKGQCSGQRYRSFLNETKSPIIYEEASSVVITEQGRLYIREALLERICGSAFRTPAEYLNFIKDACELTPR